MAEDYLAAPSPGAHYDSGGIVPLVQSRYGVRESGLIVPIAHVRLPVPLDTVATYLTGTEFFGLPIPAATTVSHLQGLPLTTVLRFCAELLHRIDSPRYSSAEVDGALQSSFTGDGWRRVRTLTASGERILVAPHVVLVLLIHAAKFSNDRVLRDVEPGLPVVAMLGTADDLEQLGDLDENEETLIVGAGVPSRMEREVVSIADFHGRLEPEHLIGRFVRRWIELPAEHALHPEIFDVSAEFARVIGVSVEEFIAAGILLYSASIVVGPTLPATCSSSGGSARTSADASSVW